MVLKLCMVRYQMYNIQFLVTPCLLCCVYLFFGNLSCYLFYLLPQNRFWNSRDCLVLKRTVLLHACPTYKFRKLAMTILLLSGSRGLHVINFPAAEFVPCFVRNCAQSFPTSVVAMFVECYSCSLPWKVLSWK